MTGQILVGCRAGSAESLITTHFLTLSMNFVSQLMFLLNLAMGMNISHTYGLRPRLSSRVIGYA
jgi:hypothetical protein